MGEGFPSGQPDEIPPDGIPAAAPGQNQFPAPEQTDLTPEQEQTAAVAQLTAGATEALSSRLATVTVNRHGARIRRVTDPRGRFGLQETTTAEGVVEYRASSGRPETYSWRPGDATVREHTRHESRDGSVREITREVDPRHTILRENIRDTNTELHRFTRAEQRSPIREDQPIAQQLGIALSEVVRDHATSTVVDEATGATVRRYSVGMRFMTETTFPDGTSEYSIKYFKPGNSKQAVTYRWRTDNPVIREHFQDDAAGTSEDRALDPQTEAEEDVPIPLLMADVNLLYSGGDPDNHQNFPRRLMGHGPRPSGPAVPRGNDRPGKYDQLKEALYVATGGTYEPYHGPDDPYGYEAAAREREERAARRERLRARFRRHGRGDRQPDIPEQTNPAARLAVAANDVLSNRSAETTINKHTGARTRRVQNPNGLGGLTEVRARDGAVEYILESFTAQRDHRSAVTYTWRLGDPTVRVHTQRESADGVQENDEVVAPESTALESDLRQLTENLSAAYPPRGGRFGRFSRRKK